MDWRILMLQSSRANARAVADSKETGEPTQQSPAYFFKLFDNPKQILMTFQVTSYFGYLSYAPDKNLIPVIFDG